MPDITQRIEIKDFGGVNVADQSNTVASRSFQTVDGGAIQVKPMESPDMWNCDYDSQGITIRSGSTIFSNIGTTLLSSEEIIGATGFKSVTQSQFVIIAVGVRSIYIYRSSSWSRINTDGGTPYEHSSAVSKCTFCVIDGHLFIGLDGDNPIQVYRGGSGLDCPFRNSTATTTVDVNSLLGQNVLSVAATTMFKVGDRVLIADGTAREETNYIVSISAGDSITLLNALTYDHTAAHADPVKVENLYETAYDSTTYAITGDIDQGNYLLASINSRLIISTGEVLLYFSPMANTTSSGIWDMADSGYYQASSGIVALSSFTPHYADTVTETLYIGTNIGWEIIVGFSANDGIIKLETDKSILNHQSFCKSKNWLIYLTDDKNIYGINGSNIIDLGRRARSTNLDGPLDSLDVDASEASSFAFYDSKKEQAQFFFSTDESNFNNKAIVLDFKLGEPYPGQPLAEYESYVRLLPWSISTSSTEQWFCCCFKYARLIIAFLKNGESYEYYSGRNDLEEYVVSGYFLTPVFFNPHEMLSKQYLEFILRGVSRTSGEVYFDCYINRSNVPVLSSSFTQGEDLSIYNSAVYNQSVYSEIKTEKWNSDLDVYAESIQFKVSNSYTPGAPVYYDTIVYDSSIYTTPDLTNLFVISTEGIRYLIGQEER